MESIESSGSKIEAIRILRDEVRRLGIEAENAPSDAQRETLIDKARQLSREIKMLEQEAGL